MELILVTNVKKVISNSNVIVTSFASTLQVCLLPFVTIT